VLYSNQQIRGLAPEHAGRRWPPIRDRRKTRPALQNIYQRNNLTVNNGAYYIDKAAQAASGTSSQPISNYSVFTGGQTYHVFFLFAKPDTVQTYQIYVGPGFEPAADLSLDRVGINTAPLKFTPGPWPQSDRKDLWGRDYDPNTGILTVTVNMSSFQHDFDAARETNCQPASFCSWNQADSQCECSQQLKTNNPTQYNECIAANPGGGPICSWAVKDLDRPEGGCLGFSFKRRFNSRPFRLSGLR
jgi:hypothetical protein